MNRNFRGKSRQRGGKFFRGAKSNFGPRNKKDFNKKTTYNTDRSDVKNCTVTETVRKLKETDVGITEYISEHDGFNGVIKHRYEDFHVNEIDCEGNIVTLSSTEPPETKEEQTSDELASEEHLKSLVSPEVFEKIETLVNKNDGGNSEVEIEVTEKNKDDRRNLHNAIKAVGGGHLISNTKQKEEKKFIIISRHNTSGKCDRRSAWPSHYGGDYVHFVLHKGNLDTMETVNFIASRLRIKPNMITYAGTKDRRGVTSQKMSIWRVEPKKLADLNSGVYGVSLGNYSFKTKGLKLGDLKGNRFRIVLRNVTGSDEQIKLAVSSLSEKGFLNYFGLQRFGSSIAVPTHAIGKALLQGDWKLAVELILKPREGEINRSLAEARNIWWKTRNAYRALRGLANREKLIEGKLLHGLCQCAANDYVNALEKIPRNTRLLYLHSYQSLVWNKVVSRRARELGIKPISGDLIFVNDAQSDVGNKDVGDEESENSEYVEHSIRKRAVKVITEDDLTTVGIHDIVMPLPGHDVIYPNNVMKDWFEEILESDGLSSATLKQSVRKYSVGGTYRKMVIRPDSLSWKTMHYSDPYKKLVLSDMDKINNEDSPKDEPDSAFKALILDFSLPSSTYATMALREILKSDTSSQHQATLNDYHIQKKEEIASASTADSVDKTNATGTSTVPTEKTESDQSISPDVQEKMSVDEINEQSKLDNSTKSNPCVEEGKDEKITQNEVDNVKENDIDIQNQEKNEKCNENVQSNVDNPTKSEPCIEKGKDEKITQNEVDNVKENDIDMQSQEKNEKCNDNVTRKREADSVGEDIEEKKMKLDTNLTE